MGFPFLKQQKVQYNAEVLRQAKEFILLNPEVFDPDRIFDGKRMDIPGVILHVYFQKPINELMAVFPLDIQAMQAAANIMGIQLDKCNTLFYIDDWPKEFKARWVRLPKRDYVPRAWFAVNLIDDFIDRLERRRL